MRTALFLGALVGAGLTCFGGCSSSDRPASALGTSSGAPPLEGSVLSDAGADQDIGDAPNDQQFSDDGYCLDNGPAPTIDGGFVGGDDAGVPICPTSGTCAAYCDEIVALYKLGVAQVAVTCMRKLPDCDTALDVRLCVQNALMAACKDPTAAQACAPLVLPCDPNAGGFGSLIDEDGCEALMTGLNTTGRGALTACIRGKIDAGTCATEVTECTDQIQP